MPWQHSCFSMFKILQWLLCFIFNVGKRKFPVNLMDEGKLLVKYFPCIQYIDPVLSVRELPIVVGRQAFPLRWRHNGRDGVSNHQPHNCLRKCRSKKTSKLRVTGLCVGNLPGTSEFPALMASNAENVSISWCRHNYSGKWELMCW